jgi:hypothetical protein
MEAALNPSLPKAGYVPQAQRKSASTPRPTLPRELLHTPASVALRLVAWTGAAVRAPAVTVTVEPPSPTQSARVFFADLPWSGARPAPPTAAGLRNSVQSIFGRFRWGD